jgi:hypothetical protein
MPTTSTGHFVLDPELRLHPLILEKETKASLSLPEGKSLHLLKRDMTKKDLVALADALRIHNRTADGRTEFTPDHLLVLADFCASQSPNLDRKRWVDYITAEGRPSDEVMFVEPDSTVIPEAIVEGTVEANLPRVNRGEDGPKRGQKRPSAHC